MSFGVLAAGCSFDASRHRNERRLFTGVSEAASQPASGAVALGSLDFFAEPAVEAVVAEEDKSKTKQERRKQRKAAAAAAVDEPDAAASSSAAEPDAAQMSEREVADANALRRAMRIHVYGTSIPAPVQSAEQMADAYAFPAWLRRNVLEAGYHELTRVQMQSVPLLAHGRELLACAPTGSGKTAAFLIPMLLRLAKTAPKKRAGLRGLAIAPTQELARQTVRRRPALPASPAPPPSRPLPLSPTRRQPRTQDRTPPHALLPQHRELLKLGAGSGISSVVLSKTIASAAASLAERDGKTPWRKYDVLVCTPLRLVSLIKKRAISLDLVACLVLDEADKLLELGFLEQIDEIFAACSSPTVQRALFSATMLPAVEDLANSVLRTPARLVVGEKNAAADLVEQKLVFCGREDGKLVALRQLVREGIKPPVLICNHICKHICNHTRCARGSSRLCSSSCSRLSARSNCSTSSCTPRDRGLLMISARFTYDLGEVGL